MGYKIYDKAKGTIKGVLFDMDGVVLDTEKLYARFWAEAAHALGYPMTYEQALGMRSLNGDAGQRKLESYFGPGVSRKVMRDKRVELMDAFVAEHGVEAKPGVLQLVDYLKAQGIRVAIATSSPLARAKKYLDGLGLTEKFDCICSGHDVAHGKPEPDIYLHAAACLGLKPENCLAIEDSPAGIESAYRAGCMPVLVPDLDGSDEEMRKMLFAEAEGLADIVDLVRAHIAEADARFAKALLDSLPDRQYSPAVLIGEVKDTTALLQVFLKRMEKESIRVLSCSAAGEDTIRAAQNCVLLFENIQDYAEAFSAQETFINAFNESVKNYNTIVVTSDREIHKLNVEERMKARLLSGVVAQIGDK